jgi:hypothetical protein
VVAPATTRRRDRVVCFVVSRLCEFLCEDYILLCEDYGFSLIYILFRLMYTISIVCPVLEAPHPGRQPNMYYIKKAIYFLINREIYGHVARVHAGGRGGGVPIIFIGYV